MKKEFFLKKDQLKYGVIVCLIIIAIVITSFYFKGQVEYDNNNIINNEKNEIDNNQSKLDENSDIIKELIARYDNESLTSDEYILYKQDTLSPNELTDEYIKQTASQQIENKNYFTKKNLNEQIKKLYGPNMKVEQGDFKAENCAHYIYNKTTGEYWYNADTECEKVTQTQALVRKITEVNEEKNKYLVTLSVAIIDEQGAIKTPMGEEIINLTKDNFDISKDYDKLSKYQYTFIYNKEEKDYYLKSIDKVSNGDIVIENTPSNTMSTKEEAYEKYGEIANIYYNIISGQDRFCGVWDYFTNETVTVHNLSKNTIESIVLYNLSKDGIDTTHSTFTKDTFNNKLHQLFGKNYNYINENIDIIPGYTYDQEQGIYTPGPSGYGGACGPYNEDRITSVNTEGNNIIFEVRVIFKDITNNTKTYYKDYERTELLNNLDLDEYGYLLNTTENMEKGSLYKVTFTNEDGNYIFVSSELIEW